ncbi:MULTISPECIES: 3'-5' exonuclease [Persicobacter]|uniref:3'-exoribonuclease n=1 Tax=Persicobacter diffluens TaxID=981 RepID=A0AAN4VU86_9BACT|nr:3'-5' exonuclease [Persicobacter sp. CCB-QB2]GJM59828.1 3'-exoribonuclease [Persicobacter diffluens]
MYQKEISKEEVNELPLTKYEGEVVYITEKDELQEALKEIEQYNVVGFDTETKPNFRKGENNGIALIQIATEEKVYLIRVKQTGMTARLADFLSNPDICKVGIALTDDIRGLKEIGDILPNGYVDLAVEVKNLGLKVTGARNLSAIFLGIRISKNQQTSNWEKAEYSPQQIDYAATDAWICLEIFRKIQMLEPAFY